MLNKKIYVLIVLLVISSSIMAQTTYFGKNKVQYKQFDWQYIQTRHFDIYFNGQMYETAKFGSAVLESSYVEISNQLNYQIHRRIPIFIYNSPNDFQQTNIVSSILPEGVGGFTEAFKNRVAIPFNGSLEDFRHVLHHELTHAVTYDMIYGNSFSSLVSRQRLFNMPLWLAEGYAEYSSRYGWDYSADMTLRDAVINNYIPPLEFMGGYLVYKVGQAFIKYIADNYGIQKIGTIFAKGKALLTAKKAVKAGLGITIEDLWTNFLKEQKKRYWPEIARRDEPGEIAKALTNHEKDESNFNANPVFSPKGDRLAMFSDRSDYIEIYLISAVTGEIIDRLVQAQRSGDLESLHSYLSGITFSPDGERMAFVAKSEGKDAIYFFTVKDKKIYKRKYFNFNSILSPVWSPDGKKLAFSALDGRRRDIIVYDIEKDTTIHLIHDTYDDLEPSWFPDSKRIAFSSDRSHPDNDFILKNSDYTPEGEVDFRTLYHMRDYGNYSLFTVDLDSRRITPIMCGPGQNHDPDVASDGRRVCFISNRNGIDNLYITYLDSSATYAVTNILTNVGSPSWSPDGKRIAFSSFHKGGFDIFIIKDPLPVNGDGVLEPTDFARGLYGQPQDFEALFTVKRPSDADSAEISVLKAHEQAAVADSSDLDRAENFDPKSDTTRIEDGEYVYVSEKSKIDPLDKIFKDVKRDSTDGKNYVSPEEKAVFDSIASDNRLPNGEYKVHDYRVKFTPDYVSGGFSYDTFYGLQGQSIFVFSDYLGDHQIILATDLVNTIDQTNFQMYYFYSKRRVNLGVGIFHSKNYYVDTYNYLFSDRFYGAQAYMAWPFSMFSRFEASLSQFFIDRKYQDYDDPREDRSSKVLMGKTSLVQDNILWGVTGPLNGRRARLDISGAIDIYDSKNISFYSAEFDYRKYWHIKGLFSTAIRFTGGASDGTSPKRYFLGGTSNKIGSTTIDAEIYDVENLYFSDVVTPLRGFDYYELTGTKYFLTNLEFRYPFVEYLKMNFPLPLTIGYITGNIFLDAGAAWDKNSTFKGATAKNGPARLQGIKSAFGFGIRANLGIFVLRYDLAWRTDFAYVADHPKYYFSIGADF